MYLLTITSVKAVALLAEGVDRNNNKPADDVFSHRSPSSRRAWIEISSSSSTVSRVAVALLAEGVDRNCGLGSALVK